MADVMVLTDIKPFQFLFFATMKMCTTIANVIFKGLSYDREPLRELSAREKGRLSLGSVKNCMAM